MILLTSSDFYFLGEASESAAPGAFSSTELMTFSSLAAPWFNKETPGKPTIENQI